MIITEEQFDKFEEIRKSNIISMFDIRMVAIYSNLDINIIRKIENNYIELERKYLFNRR